MQQPSHLTPKTVRLPTCSLWAFTSASDCVNTPSSPATAEQSNSASSWIYSSSWVTDSSQLTPQLSTSSMPPRFSLTWTTKIIQPKENQSHTSDLSWQQPARFERASTSFSACTNMDALEPPLSATILLLRGSTRSAPWTPPWSSGPRSLDLEQPD